MSQETDPETDPETGVTGVTLRFDRNSDPWMLAAFDPMMGTLEPPFNWHIVDLSTGTKADEGSNYIGPPMEIKGDQ